AAAMSAALALAAAVTVSASAANAPKTLFVMLNFCSLHLLRGQLSVARCAMGRGRLSASAFQIHHYSVRIARRNIPEGAHVRQQDIPLIRSIVARRPRTMALSAVHGPQLSALAEQLGLFLLAHFLLREAGSGNHRRNGGDQHQCGYKFFHLCTALRIRPSTGS